MINSVDWELFDKSRKLIAYNSKNENNLWKDEIVLFLREDQFETRSEQEILKHVTYSKHKQFGYDRSELKFQISFSNAVMYPESEKCTVTCRITGKMLEDAQNKIVLKPNVSWEGKKE